MEYVGIVNVVVVNSLRWFESHVVMTWVVVLPEYSHLRVEQWAGVPA